MLSPRSSAVSNPDLVAAARFAAVRLRSLPESGVAQVQAEVADRASAALIDLADEFAIPVVSSRDETERAGIVVLVAGCRTADPAHRIPA